MRKELGPQGPVPNLLILAILKGAGRGPYWRGKGTSRRCEGGHPPRWALPTQPAQGGCPMDEGRVKHREARRKEDAERGLRKAAIEPVLFLLAPLPLTSCLRVSDCTKRKWVGTRPTAWAKNSRQVIKKKLFFFASSSSSLPFFFLLLL